jgi:hypothetical protein
MQNPDRLSSGKRATVVMILALSLGGCVSHTWVPGPDVHATFEEQSAQCSMIARHGGSGFAASGSPGYVAGVAIGNAIGNAVQANADFNDCMAANGWQIADQPPVAASVAAPVALTAPMAPVAAPTPLMPPAASGGPPAPAALTASLPPPPVIAAAQPQGRVVLFPVTIFNEYYPTWTYDVVGR